MYDPNPHIIFTIYYLAFLEYIFNFFLREAAQLANTLEYYPRLFVLHWMLIRISFHMKVIQGWISWKTKNGRT